MEYFNLDQEDFNYEVFHKIPKKHKVVKPKNKHKLNRSKARAFKNLNKYY